MGSAQPLASDVACPPTDGGAAEMGSGVVSSQPLANGVARCRTNGGTAVVASRVVAAMVVVSARMVATPTGDSIEPGALNELGELESISTDGEGRAMVDEVLVAILQEGSNKARGEQWSRSNEPATNSNANE